MDLAQMGRVDVRLRGGADLSHASAYWLAKARRHMVEAILPCVHVSDLFDLIGFGDVDVLHIDTEGFDFFLLDAIDFNRIRPIAIEVETKSWMQKHVAHAQRKLEAFGYRLYDANAPPDAVHWRERWAFVEAFALRTGPNQTRV